MLYSATCLIISLTSLSNSGQTGNIFKCISGPNRSAEFCFSYELESSSYSSSTSDPCAANLIIEHSPDQTSWIELHKLTQTAAGIDRKTLSNTLLLPYIRARTVLGGSTPPQHKAKVYLHSNDGFLILDAGAAPALVSSKTRGKQVPLA